MYTLSFIFLFLLGIIIGSFLNVVIYRFNTGRSIISGRSMCMTCSRHLRWYELIPVFSFLIQSGKCRRCAVRISHQYPLVEFITGIVFVLTAFKLLPILSFSFVTFLVLLVLYIFIFSLLIVISVYDLKHKIIPNPLVYVFIIVSFLTIFINQAGFGSFFKIPSLTLFIYPFIYTLPFFLIGILSKEKWMGVGDSKLMLGMGFMLGPLLMPTALVLSFWIGSVISLLLIFVQKGKFGMKTEVPFAPFLIISTFITFIFSLDIFTFLNLFKLF